MIKTVCETCWGRGFLWERAVKIFSSTSTPDRTTRIALTRVCKTCLGAGYMWLANDVACERQRRAAETAYFDFVMRE